MAVTSTGLFRLRNMDETPGVVPYPWGGVDPIQEWAAWPLGKACAEARDTLIRDMKDHDMYVGNLENQGLVRLIQHLGIDAMQRAEILTQPTVKDMQQALLERIESPKNGQQSLDGGSFSSSPGQPTTRPVSLGHELDTRAFWGIVATWAGAMALQSCETPLLRLRPKPSSSWRMALLNRRPRCPTLR